MTACYTLSELYNGAVPLVVTAHRGASFLCPENTAPAMAKAVELGAHMIEFDLRLSADGVPVLLHDATIDRTSDGCGRPEEYSLAALREFNFAASRKNGEFVPIPTFEDILRLFRGRACMNIQIYVGDGEGIDTVCALYRDYDMYDYGYLTIADWEIGKRVRHIDSCIEICMTPGWDTRSNPESLRHCREFGCRFVQPVREFSSAETFSLCRELGLRENVFFADDPAVIRQLVALGARGVMTNRPENFAGSPRETLI